MIRYALSCDANHEFEAWFSDSADFEAQARRGFVSCPLCGSARVHKQIMAPTVVRKDRDTPAATDENTAPLLTGEDREMRAMLAALRAKLVADAEDVGPRFAEEARSMHLGETEARAIHGRATLAEARDLHEEGVPFLPLPDLPDTGH